jgi:hypothetical protein
MTLVASAECRYAECRGVILSALFVHGLVEKNHRWSSQSFKNVMKR